MMPARILFGGTFDPVHKGHLYWADTVRQNAGVEQIYLLPSAVPPHRQQRVSDLSQRIAMLRLALTDQPGLLVDDCEQYLSAPSYTLRTVQYKQKLEPGRVICWVMGEDSLYNFHRWYQWQQLLDEAAFIVMHRQESGGNELSLPEPLAMRWQNRDVLTPVRFSRVKPGEFLVVNGTTQAYSSSAIRAALRQSDTVPAGVPLPVLDYIRQQRLYRDES